MGDVEIGPFKNKWYIFADDLNAWKAPCLICKMCFWVSLTWIIVQGEDLFQQLKQLYQLLKNCFF